MDISEAEAAVMAVLWQASCSLTADEVIAALADQRDWQPATVKTLLNRLLNKAAVAVEQEGRRYRYRPVLERDVWLLNESGGLLERLFGGRVAPLVAHFARHRKLSQRDLTELRQLIEGIDDER